MLFAACRGWGTALIVCMLCLALPECFWRWNACRCSHADALRISSVLQLDYLGLPGVLCAGILHLFC